MGRHLRSEPGDGLFHEDNHPGCMWGIIHALNYHHWQNNVKKMLPHKRPNGSRQTKGNGSPKAILMDVHNPDEVQKLLDTETSHFLIHPSTTETTSTNKRSLKARIKALISDEISKEDSSRRRASGLATRSQLRRTYSIHQLEPSDHRPHGKSTGGSHPIIFLHKKADTDNVATTRLQDRGHVKGTKKPDARSGNLDDGGNENVFDYLENVFPEKSKKAMESSVNQKHMEANQYGVDASHCQTKEYPDVLEIFGVNKDLFSKHQQDEVGGLANCSRAHQASNARTRLTKSGSFPAADFSRFRNFRPSKLERKQSEVWSFPKGEKSFAGSQAPKLEGQGSNKVGTDPLYENKQRIEYAVGEHKDKSRTCQEIGGSVYDLNKVPRMRIRRTFSADESLERYAKLFQNSFSRDAKLHLSKSLKSTNEFEISSSARAPRSFKRVHSLPQPDSYCPQQNDSYCPQQNDQSCDAHSLEIPIVTDADSSRNVLRESHDEQTPLDLPLSTQNYVSLESNSEIEDRNNIVERSDSSLKREHLGSTTEGITEHANAKMVGLGEEMDEQKVWERTLDEEKEITLAEIANNKFQQSRPVSVLISPDEVTRPVDFPTSDELECRSGDVAHKESSVDSDYMSCSDTISSSCEVENFKVAHKRVKSNEHIDLCEIDNSDFNYVSILLELSGFDGSGLLGTWHSLEQPLDPLVFEEVEACWPHESKFSGEENFPCCHHQLLFDLMNEVLVQIYDVSITYYPRALSSNCRVRPRPVKSHFLEEVWARISFLSSRQVVDQSVECIVAQDLRKDDGWMNLQLESECVALELEDLIFDELVEEILFS